MDQGASDVMISLSNNVLGHPFGYYLFSFYEAKNNILLCNSSIYFGYHFDDYPNVKNNIFKATHGEEGVNGNMFGVDMTTVFIDDTNPAYSDDGQYILKSDSPAKGAGVGGTDCGMFGGSSPYKLSGIPGIPNIYELNVPENGYTNDGINVEIKVKSNN